MYNFYLQVIIKLFKITHLHIPLQFVPKIMYEFLTNYFAQFDAFVIILHNLRHFPLLISFLNPVHPVFIFLRMSLDEETMIFLWRIFLYIK